MDFWIEGIKEGGDYLGIEFDPGGVPLTTDDKANLLWYGLVERSVDKGDRGLDDAVEFLGAYFDAVGASGPEVEELKERVRYVLWLRDAGDRSPDFAGLC